MNKSLHPNVYALKKFKFSQKNKQTGILLISECIYLNCKLLNFFSKIDKSNQTMKQCHILQILPINRNIIKTISLPNCADSEHGKYYAAALDPPYNRLIYFKSIAWYNMTG